MAVARQKLNEYTASKGIPPEYGIYGNITGDVHSGQGLGDSGPYIDLNSNHSATWKDVLLTNALVVGGGIAVGAGLPAAFGSGAAGSTGTAGAAGGVGATDSAEAGVAGLAGGPTGLGSGGAAGLDATGSGLLSGSSMSKAADLLTASGKLVGGASTAAGANRVNSINPFIQEAGLEDKQRAEDLQNIFKQGFNTNFKGTPFDPSFKNLGGPQYAASLQDLSTQGAANLKSPRKFAAANAPSIDPSTMEQIGNWLGPILGIAGTVVKDF